MSKTKDTTGITFQEGKGYKKCIGFYMHEDGRRMPKIHWLGHDKEHALYLAHSLGKAWVIMQGDGPRAWTSQDVASVKAFIGTDQLKEALKGLDRRRQQLDQQREQVGQFGFMQPNATATVEPKAAATPSTRPMLYAAIEAYKAAIKGKRTSDKHKQRAQQVVEVNLKAVRKDCPLADIDFAWIDALCDHYKNRPGNLKDGTPLKPGGVKNILTYLRLFFQWVDDTSWGKWEAPRKLLKPFKMRINDLMTPVELRALGTIQQFDTGTLTKLYKAATDRQRAIMLAALFTGGTQQELAVLEQSEFDLDAAALHHYRHKTKVEGRYWLPSELVAFLRADFAKRPKDALVFRTVDGNALVTFKEGRQTSDSVRQGWDDLRVTAEVPDALSFKYLRKYLGDWMLRNGGEAMGQIALSHSRKTVLAKHYTSNMDFEKFNELQRKMHAELTVAGVFKVEKEVKGKGKKAA